MRGKSMSSFVLIFALIITSMFMLGACGKKEEAKNAEQTEAQNNAATTVAPSGDRKVMLYSSLKENQLSALKEGFNKKYPDITFDYYAAGTGKVLTKIATEQQSGQISADLIWVGDPSNYLRFKESGLLEQYKSPEAETIDPKFEDSDGYFIGARIIVLGFSYNTVNVKESEVPKNWKDLLRPEFKDQLVMSDPAEAGTTMYALSALVSSPDYGWDYFKHLKENGMLLESGTSATINKVGAGAFKVGIGVDYVTRTLADQGSTIKFAYPEKDLVVVSSPIALMKNSPNPEEGRLLYDFILSEEGQTILAENQATPVRRGIKINGLPVEEIAKRTMEVDDLAIADMKQEVLDEFDKLFK